MKITVCGAAGEVTGSGYLVETDAARVLVDFGMFQGRRATDARNRDLGPVRARDLQAVVLTHAHLDHSGRLPLLAADGLEAPIHATPATVDFADLILRDSAHIQESDAERDSQRARRAGRRPTPPLYTSREVDRVRPLFQSLPYREEREVAPGIVVRFVDAGHILGSASVEMTVEDGGERRTVVFSGDIGPRGVPFLRDPVHLERADLVFLESTYGGREHRSLEATVDELHEILARGLRHKAKILIPAFAIGRSQQILFHLAEMIRSDDLPEFPIYLDSPMAITATRLYAKHQDLFDAEAKALVRRGQFARDLEHLKFLPTARDSARLNDDTRPGVIIAGSGMCNGGRILHHFKHHLWRANTQVLLVGYQAEGTLGHQLVEGAKFVRIYGQRVKVEATVHTLGGFSAHAGQRELVEWVEPLAAAKARVVLTHGEPKARDALAAAITARWPGVKAEKPLRGDVIRLG